MAFVSKSALATGTTTVTPAAPASIVAGNLLVATVTSHNTAASTLSGSTTGWTAREQAIVGASEICEIWDKIAVGSDTMPTWNFGAGALSSVDVAQFSSTTAFDQGGTATATAASPLTVTATGTDGGTGRLIVACSGIRYTGAQTATTNTDNVNGLGVGTGINVISDDGSTSQASHHRSIYCTTATTGSSADTDVMTWPVTSAREALCIVSYSSVGALSGVSSWVTTAAGTLVALRGTSTWTTTDAGTLSGFPGAWTTFSHTPGTAVSRTVTGLTTGVAYDFQVAAVDAAGTGAFDSFATATPTASATKPLQPVITSAVAGISSATVAWTVSNGGSAVTSSTVTIIGGSGGTQVLSGAGTSLSVTGLTAGTSYTFTVTCTNVIGTSVASAPSSAVIPTGGSGQVTRYGSAVLNTTVAAAVNSITYTPQTGNGLLLFIASCEPAGITGGQSVISVTDGTANTWALAPPGSGSIPPVAAVIYRCRNVVSSGPITIKVTMNVATCGVALTLVEVSGQSTVGMIDQSALLQGIGTAVSSNPTPAPTTQANELVFGFLVAAPTTTLPTGINFSNALTSQFTEAGATSTASGVNVASVVTSGILATQTTEQIFATLGSSQHWEALICTLFSGATVTVATAPTGITANGGVTSAVISWGPPSFDGGAAITDYTVQYSSTASSGPWTTFSHSASPALTQTVTGLTNGTLYYFQVAAVNSVGTGPFDNFASATPAAAAVVPTAPTWDLINTFAGNGEIFWEWIPGDTGTQPTTSYTITEFNVTTSTGLTPVVVTSNSYDDLALINGDIYTATVTATSDAGTSAASATSPSMTPTATAPPPPSPPSTPAPPSQPNAHPAISPRYAALLRGDGD